MTARVPYTQQFSPEQTPLRRLVPILRQNAGDPEKLRKAIASAFFRDKTDPHKLAGNTLIALKAYGIIAEDAALTEFGQQLTEAQGDEAKGHTLIAKRILVDMGEVNIVETLREMSQAGLKIDLQSLPSELEQRGIRASKNSSDLSGMLGWLRAAGVLDRYRVNEAAYSELIGTSAETLAALKGLSREQIAFVRAMVALNVRDWHPYNEVCRRAEELYSGDVRYNWKETVGTILQPLQDADLIEIRKRAEQGQESPEGRGGKPTEVRPAGKLERGLAEPLLTALYSAAAYAEVRAIRGKPLAEIVAEIEQGADLNERGKALGLLVIRLCQMLDLDFKGWRETDEEIAGGGELGALMDSARLIYSRWQIQCKVGPVTLEAVAKEVGMKDVTLANVILVVGTKKATESALTYRRRIVSTSSLNVIIIDGPKLQRIIKEPSHLVDVLREQARDALKLKSALHGL